IRLLVCLALLLASAGCGGGPKTATVEGKGSIDGELITFGTVGFVGEDGRVETTQIKPDGTCTAPKAPVGEVVITVITYPLPPMVRPPDAPPEPGPIQPGQARYVPIPGHYADAKQSFLH